MERRTFIKLVSHGSLTCAAASQFPAFATTSAKQANQWQSLADLPVAMQEIYPAVFADRICVAGGLEIAPDGKGEMGHLTISNKLYTLKSADSTWQQATSLPFKRHHLGLVASKRGLYALGGFFADLNDPWQARGECALLNKLDGQWQTIKALPQTQAESGYANINENIHVFGGRSNATGQLDDTNKHWVFDGTDWQSAAPLAVARNSLAACSHNALIYAVGGRIQSKNFLNQTLFQCYDSQLDRWFDLPPLPMASAGLACVSINNSIYAFGGEEYIFAKVDGKDKVIDSKAFKQVWHYDLAKEQWQTLSVSLPSTRHGLGAVVFDNRIVSLAGAVQAGATGTSSRVDALAV
ncbi:hypothetical protein HR060_05500 [Catenovulum sp. SM1970]|uniref:Kelch repeat-containing protein n=1 Tax=Marinifaba aquimaris TaxID=2741323 RepID=UPI0015729CF4|nr:kelch repeat-containing protein [Marinifaba aquimaris]NTS76319.1 hypothetical protein [Marinifaba aquimaris]